MLATLLASYSVAEVLCVKQSFVLCFYVRILLMFNDVDKFRFTVGITCISETKQFIKPLDLLCHNQIVISLSQVIDTMQCGEGVAIVWTVR